MNWIFFSLAFPPPKIKIFSTNRIDVCDLRNQGSIADVCEGISFIVVMMWVSISESVESDHISILRLLNIRYVNYCCSNEKHIVKIESWSMPQGIHFSSYNSLTVYQLVLTKLVLAIKFLLLSKWTSYMYVIKKSYKLHVFLEILFFAYVSVSTVMVSMTVIIVMCSTSEGVSKLRNHSLVHLGSSSQTKDIARDHDR